MDKKSMGAFMAQLRRERGITQRELADRLGVSDKTISRWERDEGTPDLSLIPDIADFFGVTSDELLRGERAVVREIRQEKVSGSLEKFKMMCAVALGIVFLALIAGMAVNFAFLRAYIGFFVGAALLLIAGVVQLIFTGSSLSASDDGGRTEITRLTDRFFGVASVVLGFLVSLLTVGDAYVGLRWWAFLTYGVIFAAIFFLLWAVIGSYVFGRMLKETETPYGKNLRLRRLCVYGMLGVMACTFLIHALATAGWEPSALVEGVKFEDEASFVAYMEQDIPNPDRDSEAVPIEPGAYYNANGEEITEDEAYTHTITAGSESLTFIWRNREVLTFKYSGNSLFPIWVYTKSDYQAAQEKIELTNMIFLTLYILESASTIAIYMIKKKK